MRIAVVCVNEAGKKLAGQLEADWPGVAIFASSEEAAGRLKGLVKDLFVQYDGLVFIAACGIVIRLIAPFVRNKFSDPAVVCVDTAGRFAVSLLCGHEGGANRLAFLAAASLGAMPVVTTGREVRKKFIMGIGTRRGIKKENVKEAIEQAADSARLSLDDIRLVSSVDLKKNEKGLIEACRDLDLPLVFIPREHIKNFKLDGCASQVVRRHLDMDGVCEPCALLSARRAKLILRKKIRDGVTVAIAEES